MLINSKLAALNPANICGIVKPLSPCNNKFANTLSSSVSNSFFQAVALNPTLFFKAWAVSLTKLISSSPGASSIKPMIVKIFCAL